MKLYKKLFGSILFILITHVGLLGQSYVVKGKVISGTSQEPVIGATLQETGTDNAAVTNLDGDFEITLTQSPTTLIVRYIGMDEQRVTVDRSSPFLQISMTPSSTLLQEVVVVGYGTQKRSDVTGAVSSVDLERATALPTTNVAEMLRGQAAGVQITLGSARPGGTSNILIRGQRSISGGNDPLIVMDGFPIDNINDINPDDIASIEVLKDAAAQAIYGARAANGVILVTTKRGKAGKLTIGLNSFYTTQRLTKNFELFDAEGFAQYRREARRTLNPVVDGVQPYSDDIINFGGSATSPEYVNYIAGNFVNWEEEVLRPATTVSNTVSVSGGNDNTKIFSSLNLFNQSGLIPNSNYTRGAFRLNLNQRVTNRFNLEANLNLTTDEQQRETSSLDFITISPFTGPYDADGNLVFRLAGANASSSTINPLWNIREADNRSKTNLFNINLVGNYQILPGLNFKVNALFSRRFRDDGTYRTRLHSEAIASNGSATLTNSQWGEYLVENILNYNKDINGNNNIDLTFVQSVNQRDFSRTFSTGANFSNDILGFNGISNALNFTTSRDQDRRRILGYLGRVRYNLMDKYLFTFTARQDGSSVFAENKKWGFFPAGAFAWKIQNESFMQNVKAVNELKLRLSYGAVGNEAITPFQTLGLVTNYPYIFGNTLVGGNLPGNVLPNPNLSWETSTTFNSGLDFGLFNNVLTGSIEYYKTRTTDLLTNVPLGGTSGFTSTITNGGETENSGVELLLTTNLIRSNSFKWSITSAITRNNNKLIRSGLVDPNGNPVDDVSRNRFIGFSLNPIYTFVFDGIFQTDQEALSSPQGTLGGTVNPFQPVTTLHAGAIRIKDVNEDGVINQLDQVLISTVPKWFGSFATNVSFKGFELMVDVYTVQGVTKNNPYLALFNEGGYNTSVRNGIVRDYWTPENPSNTYPRPNFNVKAQNIEILQVADASYVRLRTVSLAYNLPSSVVSRLKMGSLRLYAFANNLLTITDYKSYSPENNPNEFPDAKGFTFGLNLGF